MTTRTELEQLTAQLAAALALPLQLDSYMPDRQRLYKVIAVDPKTGGEMHARPLGERRRTAGAMADALRAALSTAEVMAPSLYEERTLAPQGEPSDDAAELMLYAENTSELYAARTANARKILETTDAGTFSYRETFARTRQWMKDARAMYRREIEESAYTFGPSVIEEAARHFTREEVDAVRNGEWSHLKSER